VVEYLILPQVAGINQALHLLGRVNLGFVALGVLLEAASLASYARLTRAVSPRGTSTFSRIWRIDMATLAISHVLPGGAAGGGGLGFKLLIAEGASGSDAGFALATQGLGSALVLNLILWVALVNSIPLTGFNPLYATAAALGGVVIAVFAAAVLALTKGEERAASVLQPGCSSTSLPQRRRRGPGGAGTKRGLHDAEASRGDRDGRQHIGQPVRDEESVRALDMAEGCDEYEECGRVQQPVGRRPSRRADQQRPVSRHRTDALGQVVRLLCPV
jgi:hypothetical protein